jgi:SMC interacting uncharacterized protein involved in chromosome segregation
LEKLIQSYKEALDSIDIKTPDLKSLETPRRDSTSLGGMYSPQVSQKLIQYQNEVSGLKLEQGMLEKQIKSLEAQVHELERAVGRGEIDMSNTRVSFSWSQVGIKQENN